MSTYRPVPHLKAYSRNEFARIFSATRQQGGTNQIAARYEPRNFGALSGRGRVDGCVHVIIRGKPWSVGAILDYLQIHERLLRRELDR